MSNTTTIDSKQFRRPRVATTWIGRAAVGAYRGATARRSRRRRGTNSSTEWEQEVSLTLVKLPGVRDSRPP
jgi:hypothetical protein